VLPRQSCRLGRACVDFFIQVLLWFVMELLRKGSAKGGGIRDARVKVHPVNWLTPEAQDPETQPRYVQSGGRDFCTAFHWKSPTKENFAHGICKKFPCGRFILAQKGRSKRRKKIFVFKRRDRGIMWGRRKALAICRVSKSLLDAGRGAERRSAAAFFAFGI
jgi:hypothetical protein